jgi:tryptophan halogenase
MNPINKIVIVGGGTAGWMAAAMLAQHLKPDLCRIELVESVELGTIGIGESTVPPIVGLIRRLGIDEQEFVRETQATYKLGIQFKGWRQRGERYFHPFGTIGRSIGTHDFYQCWLRARMAGETAALQDFSPCNVMAESGKFFPPGQARSTPIGGANYAFHVDAFLVARYLRRYAEARGVNRIEGLVEHVVRRPDGGVESLLLQDGRRIDGEFFVDCTGFRALLIGKTLETGFEDWSHLLPCDRAVVVRTAAEETIPPYTMATAQKAGWSWRIPLQHRLGHGYVYASRFSSDAEARACLLRQTRSPLLEEPRVIPFVSGRRKEFWRHNCVAVGLAGGFVEPLESTAIHLIARGLDFLLRYFPDRDCDPSLIREYNRRMAADYEEVRDFIVLHYCTTQREDTAFWRWCRAIPIPDSLQERIELFQAHGALREGVDELFRSSSWQSVFEGMGIRPRRPCPRVDHLDLGQITQTLRLARSAIHGMVQNLPTHDQYLRDLSRSGAQFQVAE